MLLRNESSLARPLVGNITRYFTGSEDELSLGG